MTSGQNGSQPSIELGDYVDDRLFVEVFADEGLVSSGWIDPATRSSWSRVIGLCAERGLSRDGVEAAMLRRLEPVFGVARPRSRTEPEARIVVDNFTFQRGCARRVWPGPRTIEMTFSLFRTDRRSADVTAELTVTTTENDTSSVVHRTRINLLSTRSKTELANRLGKLMNGPDWSAMLEEATGLAVDAQRAGAPALLLRDAATPVHDGFVLEPLALHGDPVITFGDSGSVKSYLALAGAASIHTGAELLPALRPATTMRVGLFDFEWKAEKHKARLRRLWGSGELPDIAYIPCMQAGPLAHQVERLRRYIDDFGIEYGLFDSVGLACAGPPEDAAVALEFFQALAYLELKGSWLLAHVNRSGDTQRPFGSTFWQASARSTWYVQKGSESGSHVDLYLRHRKVNDGALRPPLGIRFTFGDSAVALSSIAVPDEGNGQASRRGESAAERMVEALEDHEPQTYAELADRLGVSEVTVREKATKFRGTLFEILDPEPGNRQKRVRRRVAA